MADQTLDDPVTQARALIAARNQQFAQDVDAILEAVREVSEAVGASQLGHLAALVALRARILEKFDERLPLRPVADPVLLQLVREAYDLLENPESVIDHRDWKRAAEPFVRPMARPR